MAIIDATDAADAIQQRRVAKVPTQSVGGIGREGGQAAGANDFRRLS